MKTKEKNIDHDNNGNATVPDSESVKKLLKKKELQTKILKRILKENSLDNK
jgi:hypothetical protein